MGGARSREKVCVAARASFSQKRRGARKVAPETIQDRGSLRDQRLDRTRVRPEQLGHVTNREAGMEQGAHGSRQVGTGHAFLPVGTTPD